MNRSASVLVLVGCLTLSACKSEESPMDVQSISGVIPAVVYTGKSEQVLVIGDDTSWTSDVTVDFGAGVTVDEVNAASPTALLVTLTIDPDAAAGARDVVIGELTLSSGFAIEPRTATAALGTVAQGSIATITIDSRDVETTFDTTSTGDGITTPIVFTHVAFEQLPAGVSMQVLDVTPFDVFALMTIDVNATSGTHTALIASGPQGSTEQIPFELTVDARAPIALTPDTPVSDTIDTAFDSQSYSLTIPGGSVALLTLTSAQPYVLEWLGTSGAFEDSVTFGLSGPVVVPSGSYYGVLWNSLPDPGAAFTLTPYAESIPNTSTESEPNDTELTAQNIPLPGHIVGASMSLLEDDFFAVTVGAGDLGQSIAVGTYGPNPTDTTVEVARLEMNNSLTPIASSSDAGYQDAVVTPTINTEGTYIIIVRPSSFHAQGLPEDYSIAVWME